jgi:hypothetical protein
MKTLLLARTLVMSKVFINPINLVIFVLWLNWIPLSVSAHTGNPCPHDRPDHPHCTQGGGGETGFSILTGGSLRQLLPWIQTPPNITFMGPGTDGFSQDSEVSVPLPAGTVRDLRVLLNTASLSDGNYFFAVFRNGAPTAIQCTITPGQDRCENVTDSVLFNDFDTISLGFATDAVFSAGGERVKWSLTHAP